MCEVNKMKKESKKVRGKRVYLGNINIASQLHDWADGFSRLGYKTTIGIVGTKHLAQNNNVDIDYSKSTYYDVIEKIPWSRIRAALKGKYDLYRFALMINFLFKYDTFIFVRESLLYNGNDLKILKFFNKDVVVILTGYERWISASIQEFNEKGIVSPPWDESLPKHKTRKFKADRIRFVRLAEKYADVLFSLPVCSQVVMRPHYFFRYPLLMDNFQVSGKQRKIPFIAHAPTSRQYKGTNFIVDAVENLKKEGLEFEFQLVENLPNKEALAKYRNCDVIISQVINPGGGKLSREAIAMGKVCITNFDPRIFHLEQGKIPLVHADTINIEAVLRNIILDHEGRKELARKSRDYALEACDSAKNAQHIVDILEGKVEPEYYPSFYNKFIPADEEERELWNNSLDIIKDCEWFDERAYK